MTEQSIQVRTYLQFPGRSSARTYLRVLGLAAFCALLIWLIITKSLVAYLASGAPESALTLAPSNPEALLNLVDRELTVRLEAARRAQLSKVGSGPQHLIAAAPNPTDRLPEWAQFGARVTGVGPSTSDARGSAGSRYSDPQLRAWAERALINDPLNARALRILGQLAAAAGDEASTEKFMQAASSRSLHERLPIYYMMLKRVEQKNYDASLYYADALLRTTPEALGDVMPTLVFLAETPAASGELMSVLAKNPPWRSAFLRALPAAVGDARTPLAVLLAIKNAPDPPTEMDLRPYLTFLIDKKEYELAYYAWLQFLPAEHLSRVGLLYNGMFDFPPSGLPFDWVISSGAGVTTEILRPTDVDVAHALLIRFEQGRVEFPGVSQMLILGPGNYQFNAKFKGELIGPRGLKWRLLCAGGGTSVAESPMLIGAHPVWKEVEFSFTVPADNCRAQQLRLDLDARMSSEQLVTGEMWFDELVISRAGAASK
jgi:hypothetical protein